jgi:hypothetical protein
MATTDNCIEYDIKFFQHVKQYLNLTAEEELHMEKFVRRGFIQRDRLVEEAIAIVGNKKIVSIAGQDFCDGTDAKTVTSVEKNNHPAQGGWMISMPVRNIHTKTGGLRVVGYNRTRDEFYYFAIPNSAFAGLKIVEIQIEAYKRKEFINRRPDFDGVPRRHLAWWEYEVSTFEEMAQFEF